MNTKLNFPAQFYYPTSSKIHSTNITIFHTEPSKNLLKSQFCNAKSKIDNNHVHKFGFCTRPSFISGRYRFLLRTHSEDTFEILAGEKDADEEEEEEHFEFTVNRPEEKFEAFADEDAQYVNFTSKRSSRPPKKTAALQRFLREKGAEYLPDIDEEPELEYLRDVEESDDDDIPDPREKRFNEEGEEIIDPTWNKLKKANYKINEDEFHKITLFHCDFFIKKVPDPDDDLYDFSQMYITPPDTDVYSYPLITGLLPKKVVRLQKSSYKIIHTYETIMEYPTDPAYKTDHEVMKVFLIKHYENRRHEDDDFFLDFEEIYVIDSKTKAITRAKVVVTVPRDETRDRLNETLIVRDGGTTFKIIPMEDVQDPETIVNVMHWEKSRDKLVNYLRGFRDFSESNWF